MTNSIEERVAEQYSRRSLEQIILDSLRAAGKDVDRLTPADLVAIDEFHIGGRQATVEFGAQMSLVRGSNVLDVGCGIGGPSRYFAKELGCRMTGIDLTDEYVRVAEMLARRLGMSGAVSYRQASALKMPLEAGSFDGAYMIHVGMNIEDKAALFAEVRRVLKPGAVFGIYDVMREGDGEIRFPMPWASKADTSFVETASVYRQQLEAAGFEIRKERNRREFGIEFLRAVQARAAAGKGGTPALGLNLLMGPTTRQKISNLIEGLECEVIAPVEMVCGAK
jgi:ubiquinone/menaquinone biosynthesis C-methylase UbiE